MKTLEDVPGLDAEEFHNNTPRDHKKPVAGDLAPCVSCTRYSHLAVRWLCHRSESKFGTKQSCVDRHTLSLGEDSEVTRSGNGTSPDGGVSRSQECSSVWKQSRTPRDAPAFSTQRNKLVAASWGAAGRRLGHDIDIGLRKASEPRQNRSRPIRIPGRN
jgi:hypothetical protein